MNLRPNPTPSTSSLHHHHNRKLLISKSPNQNTATPKSMRRSQKSISLAQHRRTQQYNNRQLLVQVQDQPLYKEIEGYSIRNMVRFDRQNGHNGKEMFVVSRVQDFYGQYNEYCDGVYLQMEKVTWVIVANAINNLQIEKEFNRNYEPIKFCFVRDIQEIVNFFNFKGRRDGKRCVRLSYFSRIVSFGVINHHYESIVQQGRDTHSYIPQQDSEMWLIGKDKLKQIHLQGYLPYFLGEHSIKGQQIEIQIMEAQKIAYIVIAQNHQAYLQRAGIKKYENRTKNTQEGKNLQEQYKSIRQLVAKVSIVATDISSALVQQIFQYTGIQVKMLQSNQIYQQSDKHLIFLANHIEPVLKSKVTSIDLSQYSSNKNIHKQLIKLIKKISQRQQINLYTISSVTNFTQELKEVDFQQSGAYKVSPILGFKAFLQSLQKNTSHLIIMQMNVYNEQRQHQLRETQLMINGTIQVYLPYGNEFIFRNKSKYTFLKKEQLIKKIKDIISNSIQEEERLELDCRSEYAKFYSQVRPNKEPFRLAETVSTPNLMYYFPQSNSINLIFLIPKGIPHYSLMDRSLTPYSLLVYNRLEQVAEFIKYIPDDSFASIMLDHSNFATLQDKMISSTQQNKNRTNMPKNRYQLIKVADAGEKSFRAEIDKSIVRLQFQPKKEMACNKTKGLPIIMLYSHSDDRQVKIIRKMGELFKNSKIITMSKKEFKTIKKSYCIADNINVYEMGKPQIAHTKRIKTILQVFKMYMAPQISAHQYSAQRLLFSKKQLFLCALLERMKSAKRNRMSQINTKRSVSPKGKSLCFISQPGLTILQSKAVNKASKKQKFSESNELIGLCMDHLSKGNQILAIIDQQTFFQIKDQLALYSLQITWMVLVNDYKTCIIRQSNIIFCKDEQFDHTFSLVLDAFREFKDKGFQFSERMRQMLELGDSVESKNGFLVQLRRESPISQEFTIFVSQAKTKYVLENLKNALIFPSLLKLSYFSTKCQPLQDDDEPIFIICDHHNTKIIQQSLQIIQQTRFILLTFQHIGQLLSYSSPSKSLFILQKTTNIKAQNTLFISPFQTADSFSTRLKVFLSALKAI